MCSCMLKTSLNLLAPRLRGALFINRHFKRERILTEVDPLRGQLIKDDVLVNENSICDYEVFLEVKEIIIVKLSGSLDFSAVYLSLLFSQILEILTPIAKLTKSSDRKSFAVSPRFPSSIYPHRKNWSLSGSKT